MIRITKDAEPEAVTITVDGQLAGQNIDPLSACVEEAIREGRPIHLFLRDVTTIDDRGRALLGRLSSRGIRLRASGVYCSYIVEELRQSGGAARSHAI